MDWEQTGEMAGQGKGQEQWAKLSSGINEICHAVIGAGVQQLQFDLALGVLKKPDAGV